MFMLPSKKTWLCFLIFLPVLARAHGSPTPYAPSPRPIQEALSELVGRYEGQWELFGWDAPSQKIVSKMRWRDEVTANDPTIEGNKAYVLVIDKMIYEQANREEVTAFTEGYLINPDQTAGVRYFEAAGKTVFEIPTGPNSWVFSTVATKMDLALMGFGPSTKPKGHHSTVKMVTKEDGVEIEHISRISTISWTTQTGTRRTEQFLSLKGFHRHLN